MTSRNDVASYIDHTLLKPEATPEQFRALVKEATELGTYAVCVSPSARDPEVPPCRHGRGLSLRRRQAGNQGR